MLSKKTEGVREMMECLEGLTDPRQEKKVLHNFIETIMLVICAVIAGCDVWEDIADYCRVKEAWFREKLGLKLENGIPSHDTMERVFGMLNPEEFQKRFIEWVQKSCGKQAREVISVDGKTMRGSGGKEPVVNRNHLVFDNNILNFPITKRPRKRKAA